MKRGEARQFRKSISPNIYVNVPPISSPVALLLLNKKYYAADTSIYSDFRMMRIRNKWIRSQFALADKSVGISCAICGKKNLVLYSPDRTHVATLDHIVSISHGGSWNDPSNFQIVCYRCNQKKDRIAKNLTI